MGKVGRKKNQDLKKYQENRKDQFEKQYIPDEKEANESIDKLLCTCKAKVFKEHLSEIAKNYSVKDGELHNPEDTVAYFDVSKLIVDEKEKTLDKLKNVFHVLSYSENSIALIIQRNSEKCTIRVAVGLKNGKENDIEKKEPAKSIRNAFKGNFPGISCGEICAYNSKTETPFIDLADDVKGSAAIVTNIAAEYSEDFVSQGIEKLIDSITLEEGDSYTVVLLAEPLSYEELENKKEQLYSLYTALSPFSGQQQNWSIGEARDWSKNVGAHVEQSTNATIELGVPKVVGGNMGVGLNVGTSYSYTWGKSVNAGKGGSVEVTNYAVKHSLEIIEKQMQRLEECAALGVWNFATYVFAPRVSLVNEVAHIYMSLTQGKESFYERAAINIWNANNAKDEEQIKTIKKYIRALNHPIFELKTGSKDTYWSTYANVTSTISGAELTKAMNLPSKSVPGFTVVNCASFGREVTSYDDIIEGDVELGCIHHMHTTQERRVKLSKKSLTSHAFITGSTGAGKSNTVYQLLSEVTKDNEVSFMVIEPAKGEYRYAFGNDVRVLGTNPKTGELLRINPFAFSSEIHVFEHIERILEIFNVCWPMYAAMPAVLKDAIIKAYESCGWDLVSSTNTRGNVFPNYEDVVAQVEMVMNESEYSEENKGNYKGALVTRLRSLTNGINGLIFCNGTISDTELFEQNVIVDLSRIGSNETKSLIMGMLIIKLQEYRMCSRKMNRDLCHITVLEEAHNILRRNVQSGNVEGGNVAGKSVEMIANAIAEMRTYGEAFVIVDQSPGLMDMSVIRNTNTKIIMRLPDQTDRELVGKAAGLNSAQIDELAKLQRGVAAIYQNEWTEAVLCNVDEYKMLHDESDDSHENIGEKEKCEQQAKKNYITLCVYNPDYLLQSSELDFISCVESLNLSGYIKTLLIDFYRTPFPEKADIWRKTVNCYFCVDEILAKINMEFSEGAMKTSEVWKARIMEEINTTFNLEEIDGFKQDEQVQYRFMQILIAARLYNIQEGKVTNVEKDESEELLKFMNIFRKEHVDGSW